MRYLRSKMSFLVAGFLWIPAFNAVAQDKTQGPSAAADGAKGEGSSSTGAIDPAFAHADIDDRFSTEGYVGAYGAFLQNTVPSVGLTGSIFLDDDFRAGADLWFGQSKLLFSSFSTQGAGFWGAWELNNKFWLKAGFSYSRLERPTSQEPLSALSKTKDTTDQRPVRTDSIQADLSIGQLWSFSTFSIATDYVGFSLPIMTLTGPRPSIFNLHAVRVEALYDID